MKTTDSPKLSLSISLGLLLTPALAHAHPGHGLGLGAGVTHPLTGVDHLAAMLAVGLWASQLGGRARYLLPLAFLGSMLAGGVLGASGLSIPAVEPAILASLFVFGVLIALAKRVSAPAGALLVAAFGLFHGVAHGSELPVAADPLLYSLGFLGTTAALHGIGLLAGGLFSGANREIWVRRAGAAVLLCGVVSLLG